MHINDEDKIIKKLNTIKTFEDVSKIIYLLIKVVGSIPREHTYWQKNV